jgi:hypothetical protein
MTEIKLNSENSTPLDALKEEYAKAGRNLTFSPAEPFSFNQLDLSGVSESDQIDMQYMLGTITNYIKSPIMFDDFTDVNERSDWRSKLPKEVKVFAEQNKIRGNKIANVKMSLDLIAYFLGESDRYQKAKEMITQIVEAINEAMAERHDPSNPEALPVQPYATYSNEEKVAFVQKLDQALRALVTELEVR